MLRATDSKYGESNDSSENSDFLLLRQKDPFGILHLIFFTFLRNALANLIVFCMKCTLFASTSRV